MEAELFLEAKIGNIILKNRIIRSATYEGASDSDGFPKEEYYSIYKRLAINNIALIITGFAFISPEGRAMQLHQAGIDSDDKIDSYKKLTAISHSFNCPIVMQIAHSGRQTLESISGSVPYSSTKRASIYYRQKSEILNPLQINVITNQFADAALRVKSAGFDGVQIHAAHGYLIHQLLLPETNKMKNEYGINRESGLGTKFLEEVIEKIRKKCGDDFPLLIKISAEHNLSANFYPDKFENLIRFLDKMPVDAIEISYGTMDYALNIFRGELNKRLLFNTNPLFKTRNIFKQLLFNAFITGFIQPKLKEFSPYYNLRYAERAKKLTSKPFISVGGFRSKFEIEYAIKNRLTDFVSLSRPFINEPNFVGNMIKTNADYVSKCTNCNDCVIMCDSDNPTKCYSLKQIHKYRR